MEKFKDKLSMGKDWIENNRLFSIMLLGVVIACCFYFTRRTLFYDELWTFQHFVQEGPLYSATHYPFPNNHILYSVLCAVVYWITGNAWVSLRGIALAATLVNCCLLYYIGKKLFSKNAALVCVLFYVCNKMVNFQIVQGRGYTLSVTFFLLGLILIYCISREEKRKLYLTYMVVCALGMYTIPTFLYSMVGLSVLGGVYLLYRRYFKRLLKLIAASVGAAILTICLYMPMFVVQGYSNYAGMFPMLRGKSASVSLIWETLKKKPVEILSRGIGSLVGNQYVSSSGANQAKEGLMSYLIRQFQEVFPLNPAISVGIVAFIGAAAFLAVYVGVRRKKNGSIFAGLFVIGSIGSFAIVLAVQGVFPYERVLIFLGVPLAIGMGIIADFVIEHGKGKGNWIVAAMGVLAIIQFFDTGSRYYDTYEIDRGTQRAMQKMDLEKVTRILPGGEYQDLQFNFYSAATGKKFVVDKEKPEAVILQKNLTVPGKKVWSDYYKYEELPWKWIEREMRVVYEDEKVVGYGR